MRRKQGLPQLPHQPVPVITDIFVYKTKPWKCPDCGAIHRGECPNKLSAKMYEYESRIQVIEDALAQQAAYLEQLQPVLQDMVNNISQLREQQQKKKSRRGSCKCVQRS